MHVLTGIVLCIALELGSSKINVEKDLISTEISLFGLSIAVTSQGSS